MRPRCTVTLAAPLLLLGCAAPAPVAGPDASAARVEERRVTLRVASLGEAARLIELQTDIAISVERPNVPVELTLDRAPLSSALQLLETQTGLAVTTGPNGIHIGARRPIVRELPGAIGVGGQSGVGHGGQSTARVDVLLDLSDAALALRLLSRLPCARLDVERVPILQRPGPLATLSLRAVAPERAALALAKANGLSVRRHDDGRLELLPAVQHDTWTALDGNVVDGGRSILTGRYVGHDERVVSLDRGGELTHLAVLETERRAVAEALRHVQPDDELVARAERHLGRWRVLTLEPDLGRPSRAGRGLRDCRRARCRAPDERREPGSK